MLETGECVHLEKGRVHHLYYGCKLLLMFTVERMPISSFEWENHGKDELGFEGLLFTHRQNDLSMQGKTKTLIVIGRIIVNVT